MKCQVLNRPYSPIYICQPFPAASTVGILHLHHIPTSSVQFSSVQSFSPVWSFVTLWTAAQQAFLSISNSQSLLKLMSIESVMSYKHLILSCPLLLLPSVFPNIRVFSKESVLPIQFSSVAQSCLTLCNTMNHSTPGLPVHHTRLPRVYPNPCPLSRWCNPTISSSVFPFSSCSQSVPVSGSFPMSQLFPSGGQSILGLLAKIKGSIFPLGGQSIGVSASASVLPMNILDWFLLGWTGLISFQSKGLSRVFSKHHSSKASILWHSALAYSFPNLEPVCCSVFSSNCCFLTCI